MTRRAFCGRRFFHFRAGIWADRNDSRLGKFRPFLIWACLPLAIAGVLTFTTPGFIETNAGKLVWAIVTYHFLMIMFPIVKIPCTALMGVMTDDSVVRTRRSSVKFVFAFSAGTVISFAPLPVVGLLGGKTNPQLGWLLAFVMVGLVAIGFLLVTGFNTRERIHPKIDPTSSLMKNFKILLNNKPWGILLCTTLTWILFIADRFPKRIMFISLLSMHIACTSAYLFLQAGQIGVIFILEIPGTFVGAPLPVLMWAMYADTADHGEWQSGRHTTARVFPGFHHESEIRLGYRSLGGESGKVRAECILIYYLGSTLHRFAQASHCFASAPTIST